MNENRYIRQIALPHVGLDGQEKLKQARVLVVGAGGLGNAVIPYLASSGVGTIGVIDGDTVSYSNLHRQIMFAEQDNDASKSETICTKLGEQFSDVSFEAYNTFLSGQNALAIFRNHDLIVDATDAIATRYLINDACILTQKPFVHASIYRFQFQVASFNVAQSGSYRCLYPIPPKNAQSCAEAGVMPTTVALAGLYQANEVFKYFLAIGEMLTNKMLLVDTLSNRHDSFAYTTKEHAFLTPSYFTETYSPIEKIRFTETEAEGFFLDVRNADEEPTVSLTHYQKIALNQLAENLALLPHDRPIYIFCQSGSRSVSAYQMLKENQFNNVYCLHENANQINPIKLTEG